MTLGRFTRSTSLKALALALALSPLAAFNVHAQEKTLRVAMTAADIPRTNGQPDQGFEGNRFTGTSDEGKPVTLDLRDGPDGTTEGDIRIEGK